MGVALRDGVAMLSRLACSCSAWPSAATGALWQPPMHGARTTRTPAPSLAGNAAAGARRRRSRSQAVAHPNRQRRRRGLAVHDDIEMGVERSDLVNLNQRQPQLLRQRREMPRMEAAEMVLQQVQMSIRRSGCLGRSWSSARTAASASGSTWRPRGRLRPRRRPEPGWMRRWAGGVGSAGIDPSCVSRLRSRKPVRFRAIAAGPRHPSIAGPARGVESILPGGTADPAALALAVTSGAQFAPPVPRRRPCRSIRAIRSCV